MITFTLCLLALIVGYFTYGRLMERVFGPDDRKTPALTKADGVDYIPLPTWKIFMIQFLNIAGLGPIFGAIMGAKFGSSSYLWIVLGSIFAGAVHDYFAGMLSLRHEGESLPEIIGRYLGLTTKQIMRGFTVILMILVGSVFVAGPAGLLAKLTPESLDATFWIIVVFADRWHREDPFDLNSAWIPGKYPSTGSWASGQNNNYDRASDFWLTNIVYLRLKELELGYTIPQQISLKAGIKRFRVYFSGTNLITFDNIDIVDPEIDIANGVTYPPTKLVSIGFNATF